MTLKVERLGMTLRVERPGMTLEGGESEMRFFVTCHPEERSDEGSASESGL
jgi:hypothetical protein